MYQHTFLLLCTLPALTDSHLSAEALRTLLTTAMQSQQPLEYVVLQEKTTALSSAHVISLNARTEFHVHVLSLSALVNAFSLLLPRVRYAFTTNIFKQLQRQLAASSEHELVTLLLGQIALYRNPSSCRQFFDALTTHRHDALVCLSQAASELALGASRTNTWVCVRGVRGREKRETLVRAFAHIQEYAMARESDCGIRKTPSIFGMAKVGEKRDIYSTSGVLPVELVRMEVLYNLGRAFHQVRVVWCE